MCNTNDQRFRRDDRVRSYVLPARVMSSEKYPAGLDNIRALLKRNEDVCVLSSANGVEPVLVLDFGQELHGGVSIDVLGETPGLTEIRLRFGESLAEVMGRPSQDHAIHDMVLSIPILAKQEFGMTGFRFVRLDVLTPDRSVKLRQIEAVTLEKDYQYVGAFECSDNLLNQIWRIGARTVHLCCQDYILDGIKRDRLVWMGDIHPQVRVIAATFGNVDIVPDSLEYMRDTTPPNQWMNNISSYSLWWIISVLDWFLYTGDMTFLRRQQPYLRALVEHLLAAVKADPTNPLPDKQFLDWASHEDKVGVAAGLHALLIWALRSAGQALAYLDSSEANTAIEPALKALEISAPVDIPSKQAQALQVLADVAEPRSANLNVLACDPCRGLSTWYAYYVLEARVRAGDHQGCLDLIRDYWGGMVQLGATTFWEHFDIDWLTNAARIDEAADNGLVDVHAEYGDYCFKGLRHSLCHGWAGGPTAWLSEHLLGVRRLTPGYGTISVDSPPVDLEYIKGAIPTPHGPVRLTHTRNGDGSMTTEIDKPESISLCTSTRGTCFHVNNFTGIH